MRIGWLYQCRWPSCADDVKTSRLSRVQAVVTISLHKTVYATPFTGVSQRVEANSHSSLLRTCRPVAALQMPLLAAILLPILSVFSDPIPAEDAVQLGILTVLQRGRHRL